MPAPRPGVVARGRGAHAEHHRGRAVRAGAGRRAARRQRPARRRPRRRALVVSASYTTIAYSVLTGAAFGRTVTVEAAAVDGAANFSGALATITYASPTLRLGFAADDNGTALSAVSAAFAVGPAAAVGMLVARQPGGREACSALGSQPRVMLKDVYNNTAPLPPSADGDAVTVALSIDDTIVVGDAVRLLDVRARRRSPAGRASSPARRTTLASTASASTASTRRRGGSRAASLAPLGNIPPAPAAGRARRCSTPRSAARETRPSTAGRRRSPRSTSRCAAAASRSPSASTRPPARRPSASASTPSRPSSRRPSTATARRRGSSLLGVAADPPGRRRRRRARDGGRGRADPRGAPLLRVDVRRVVAAVPRRKRRAAPRDRPAVGGVLLC